jgi:Amt family ammonium transporter
LWLLDKWLGLRVSKEEEQEGLDLSEHGTYAYPELLAMMAKMENEQEESPSLKYVIR